MEVTTEGGRVTTTPAAEPSDLIALDALDVLDTPSPVAIVMASEEPLFDPSLKKKKKKKAVAFFEDPLGADADPTTPAPPAQESDEPTLHEQMKQNHVKKEVPLDLGEEGSGASAPAKVDASLDMDFSDMKKKKKKPKKEIPLELGEEGSGTSTPLAKEADDGEDLDFADLKKKKKKKKAAADLEAFEKELDEDVPTGKHLDNLDEEDLGDDVFARSSATTGSGTASEAWIGSDRDYTYEELLKRFFALLTSQNPDMLQSGKKLNIPTPIVQRDGTKKTVFENLADICKKIHRSTEHVMAYMFAEMATTGSTGGENSSRLTLKGRYTQRQIENILRKYINEYVSCKTCRSADTALDKDNRIFFVTCNSCQSRRSVNAIKTGFQAQVGRRSKTKAA